MTDLPKSIQAYLESAGFTALQINILKHLFSGSEFTVRELAQKTKKGHGTIDDGCKKLVGDGILREGRVNSTTKYSLASINVLQDWMKKDMESKKRALLRQEKDFESYINSLQIEQLRPDMYHFEGLEGIKDAYMKLLNSGGEEMLHYFPAAWKEEDDPLRDFRVELFRKRQQRKIFARCIVPDTTLGYRYKERDSLEYRETKLVSPQECAIDIEKVIAGDSVALISHTEKRVCFITYGDFAQSERQSFNLLWKKQLAEASQGQEGGEDVIPLGTRILSSVRQFFLSTQNLVLLVLFAAAAAGLTYGYMQQSVHLNTQRIREKVMAIATTGAPLFDAEDLVQLDTEEDIGLPAYERVVRQLDLIRSKNENVKYAYIVRPTGKKDMYEFVADSYGLNIGDDIDFNGDGVLGPEDEIPTPGMPYDVSEIPGVQDGMKGPSAYDAPFTDQWGTFISGFAPIRNASGTAVAVLGIDQLADDVDALSKKTTKPWFVFAALFLLFVFARFFAENRSLGRELVSVMTSRRMIFLVVMCGCFSIGFSYVMYKHTEDLNVQRIRERVSAIAATAANEFSAEDIGKIYNWQDVELPEYKRVVSKLQQVRSSNKGVEYAYIMRYTNDPYYHEFVADADSLDIYNYEDFNKDGLRNDAFAPGRLWHDDNPNQSAILLAKDGPTADLEPSTDEWGVWIAGHAPIVNRSGFTVAIVGVDVDANSIGVLTKYSFSFVNTFISIWLMLTFTSLIIILGVDIYTVSKNGISWP